VAATRILGLVLLAVLIGGALIVTALVPGLGLIAILGVLVVAGLVGSATLADRRHRTQPPELLGPGGADDTRSSGV